MESLIECSFCGTSNSTYVTDRYGNIVYDRNGNPMHQKASQTRTYYRCTRCGKVLCYDCMVRLGTHKKQTHVFKSAEHWEACPSCNGKMVKIAEKSGGGDSGCFITSATLSSLNNNDDNCYELTTFRKFRDTWLLENHPEDIEEYYNIAPLIVKGINSSQNSKEVYNNIWSNHLLPCLNLIEQQQEEKAYHMYKQMVESLRTYAHLN